MRTIETTVYNFSELSEEAKQKAIEKLSTINVDFEWWESIYEDAKNAGLKITSFDLDRMNCEGIFIDSASDCAFKVTSEHGETCHTYGTAQAFLDEYNKLVASYSDSKDLTRVSYENEADELESEFLKCILEDYRVILSNEYDYLQSKEAIIETIEANGYEFTEDGELI